MVINDSTNLLKDNADDLPDFDGDMGSLATAYTASARAHPAGLGI